MFQIGRYTETESRLVVVRGWGEEGIAITNVCGVPLHGDKCSGISGDGYTSL